MIPRQLDELARQRTQLLRSEPQPVSRLVERSTHGRRNAHTLRKRTGWSLVEIGLRIAESGGQ